MTSADFLVFVVTIFQLRVVLHLAYSTSKTSRDKPSVLTSTASTVSSFSSFLVYLPDLRTKVTITFWILLLIANLSVWYASLSDFCSSSHDFAIASSLHHLAMANLQVALRFVGNYALYGLSP